MLPDKKTLRTCIERKAPSKSVLSHLKHITADITANKVSYVVDTAIQSCNRKRILCCYWYGVESKSLEYISYVDRQGDILTRTPQTPIKWYKRNVFWHFWPYIIVNENSIKKYFGDYDNSARNIVVRKVNAYKDAQYYGSLYDNKLKRCKDTQEFFKELTPIPRGVKAWAKNSVFGYEAYFNVSDRNSGVCSKCGRKFTPTSPLVSRRSYSCPHCHATLTAVTNTQLKCYKGKGFQVLSRLDDKVVVRHFIITRTHYTGDYEAKWDFYEYERDVMNADENTCLYYVKKYVDIEHYYWRNSKPSKGNHLFWTLPNLFYEDEALYRGNLSEVLKGTAYQYSGIEYLPKEDIFRAEDYLYAYGNYPCMEQLAKAGYTELAKSCAYIYRYENCKIPVATATDIPSIFGGLTKPWREYIRKNKLGYKLANSIKDFFDNGLKITDFDAAYKVYSNINDYYIRQNFAPERYLEIFQKTKAACPNISFSFVALVKYLNKNKVHMHDYCDYIHMYGALIENKWNKAALFPKNFKTAHDNASKAYEVKKDELRDKVLKKLYDRCFSKIDGTVFGDYVFVCPKSVKDFVMEGKNNNNCVAGYAKLTADGNGTVVVFMRQKNAPEKSFVTIEYRINCGNIHMVQCRGYHNHETTTEQKQAALKFAPLVLKNYQYQNKMAA